MIVDRLRVRGKLNLLLMLPLALVTADYLADPTADDAAMLLQFQAVADSAEALRRSLGPHPSDELDSALVRLGSLTELRENARSRGIALDSVARAYHAVIEALIDALRLVPQRSTDAEGTRQLTALDALLRANEESALRGMALVAVAVSPQVGRDLLDTASAQSQLFTERFVQQADADQAALVVLVDQGAAAHRVDTLVQHLPDAGNPGSVQAFVAGARDAAEGQASLRRLVQDQVTSQIAGAAGGRAGTARAAAWSVSVGAILLLALVLGLAVMVSRSIARPLQRLTRAATTTADLANEELVRVTDVEGVDEQPPRLSAIDVSSGDEVGELAVAFNRVQATAALLLERQVVTRRNVSLMFATVAQRTQNLVRRQLALVDELEKDEQNTRLLSRLYRLDHLSTRLRRSAENLLVVAGSRTETRISAPTPLTTVLRSALAEIEDYQRVNFGTVYETTIVAPLVADLVLVFAELLENATSFSPPGSTVDVLATGTTDGWCQVSVIDRGIGMTPERLAEENRRLVERERLDIVPTSVLGLFVVGRLARRHGLTIHLMPTPGGGTTVSVAVPPGLHNAPAPVAQPARTPVVLPRRPVLTPAVPAIPSVPGTFPWFSRITQERDRKGGLSRRVPGAQLPSAAVRAPDISRTQHDAHDAVAARTTMDALQTALARAESTTAPPPGGPAPLTRRTPGANLAPGLRDTTPGAAVRRHTPSPRDPEAERAAFDGFVAGLAEADRQVEKKGTS
ncbi:MAG: hypothetical protein AUG44_27815 [Actinobacteria bacterium 13_1_20CM_3_71_11]|nr:MAG: hypothetical protein AUG44_27815 [Actinobacteria bacterium 13_1_20CM_3_71_11]